MTKDSRDGLPTLAMVYRGNVMNSSGWLHIPRECNPLGIVELVELAHCEVKEGPWRNERAGYAPILPDRIRKYEIAPLDRVRR